MRTRIIAVVGSGRPLQAEVGKLAESLGAALAQAGYAILTGGRGGVMEAVARGAVRARGKSPHPPVIGLLPSYAHAEGNAYLDLVLPTGLGHARNALVAAGAEVVVCIGGATGALSEVALASKIGRPVLTFRETGGTAAVVDRALGSVVAVATVEEAIGKIRELLPA